MCASVLIDEQFSSRFPGVNGPYSFEYGYIGSLELPFMATAIVSTYTPEGFVIGADGLRKASTHVVVSKRARKLFFAEADNVVLAYGWAGMTNLESEEKSLFDFLQESELAAKSLASVHVEWFQDYVSRFTEIVYQGLLRANQGDKLKGDLRVLPEGEEIARVLFVGYFKGEPYRAKAAVSRRGELLTGVHLKELQPTPIDFDVFSGSRLMLKEFEPRLTGAPKSLAGAPKSLVVGTALVRDYIQSCIDNPYRDKECESIGGQIRIAEVTPEGSKWRTRPK